MIRIGEVEYIDKKNFNKYDLEKIDRPIIVKNAIKFFPNLERWDLDYLKEKIGSTQLSYSISNANTFPDLVKAKHSVINSDFKCFLDEFEKQTKEHWCFLSGDSACIFSDQEYKLGYESLKADLIIPSFIKKESLDKIGIWISKKGVKSRIHYDSNGCHNYNIQIKGSKKVKLFSPFEYENMYFKSYNDGLSFFNFSEVITDKDSKKQFPLLKKVYYLEGIMEEGDAIFIPQFWIHYFHHLGRINLNLNFWWHGAEMIVNPISVNWIILNASAQMISHKHPILPKKLRDNLAKKYKDSSICDLDERQILRYSREISRVFSTWTAGRP